MLLVSGMEVCRASPTFPGLQQDYFEGGIMRQLLCISSSRSCNPRTAVAAPPSCSVCRSRSLLSLLRAPPRPALIPPWPPFMLVSRSHIKISPLMTSPGEFLTQDKERSINRANCERRAGCGGALKSKIHKDTGTPMFTAVLFTIAKT